MISFTFLQNTMPKPYCIPKAKKRYTSTTESIIHDLPDLRLRAKNDRMY